MKHFQIVITNPAASPVMTGMPLLKPARNNAVVLISIPAPEQVIPVAAVRLAAENIRLVNVLADIFGAENRVPLKIIV